MYQVESIVNVFYRHVFALRTEGGEDDVCFGGVSEGLHDMDRGYGDRNIPRLPGTLEMYKTKDSLTSAL